jgi:hypothetical protein
MKQYTLFPIDRECIITFFPILERYSPVLPFPDRGKERDLGESRSFISSPDRGKTQRFTGEAKHPALSIGAETARREYLWNAEAFRF